MSIEVTQSGHAATTVHVRDGVGYRITLRPGIYTLSSGTAASRVRAVVAAG